MTWAEKAGGSCYLYGRDGRVRACARTTSHAVVMTFDLSTLSLTRPDFVEKSHQESSIGIKTKQKTKTLHVRSQFEKGCVPNVSLLYEWGWAAAHRHAHFFVRSHTAELGSFPLTLGEMGFAHAGLFIKKSLSPPISFLSHRRPLPNLPIYSPSSSLLSPFVSELLLSRHIWEPL